MGTYPGVRGGALTYPHASTKWDSGVLKRYKYFQTADLQMQAKYFIYTVLFQHWKPFLKGLSFPTWNLYMGFSRLILFMFNSVRSPFLENSSLTWGINLGYLLSQ